MYSVVLATMLTTGTAAPSFGFGWFGHGCCGGCYGCHGCYGCYGCYGCCGGCYGCHGCYGGCYGCYGCCGGCYGCNGCYGCYGCCGGCYGCYGAPVAYYSGCGGCTGSVVAPAAPAAPKEKLPAPSKATSLDRPATVVIAAPAGVTVTFNGVALNMKSTEQVFETPDLEQGSNYSYKVEASAVRDGQTITRSRKVEVSAGRRVRVDFSELAATGFNPAVANRD